MSALHGSSLPGTLLPPGDFKGQQVARHIRVWENVARLREQFFGRDLPIRRVTRADVCDEQSARLCFARHARRHRGGRMHALHGQWFVLFGESRLVNQNVRAFGERNRATAINRVGAIDDRTPHDRLPDQLATVNDAPIRQFDALAVLQPAVQWA